MKIMFLSTRSATPSYFCFQYSADRLWNGGPQLTQLGVEEEKKREYWQTGSSRLMWANCRFTYNYTYNHVFFPYVLFFAGKFDLQNRTCLITERNESQTRPEADRPSAKHVERSWIGDPGAGIPSDAVHPAIFISWRRWFCCAKGSKIAPLEKNDMNMKITWIKFTCKKYTVYGLKVSLCKFMCTQSCLYFCDLSHVFPTKNLPCCMFIFSWPNFDKAAASRLALTSVNDPRRIPRASATQKPVSNFQLLWVFDHFWVFEDVFSTMFWSTQLRLVEALVELNRWNAPA